MHGRLYKINPVRKASRLHGREWSCIRWLVSAMLSPSSFYRHKEIDFFFAHLCCKTCWVLPADPWPRGMSREEGKRRDPDLLHGGTSTAMSPLSWATCRVSRGIWAPEGHSTDISGHMQRSGEAAEKVLQPGERLQSQKPCPQCVTTQLLPAQPGSGLLSPQPRCHGHTSPTAAPSPGLCPGDHSAQVTCPALTFPPAVRTSSHAAHIADSTQGWHTEPASSLHWDTSSREAAGTAMLKP